MRFKAVTLGVVLAGTALGSAALTVGRARGAAWIGQPLELTVPVQLDPGQTDANLCAEADVFHGDSRQDPSRVQVVASPSDQADTVNLKITSSALIDEPVVTIYLRAGCGQKVSRKYVLLADFPSDAAAPLSRSATPTAPQVPLVIPSENASASGGTASANAGTAATSKPVVKSSKPSTAANTEAPKEAAPPAKPAAKPGTKAVAKEASKEASAPKKEASAKADKPVETAKPETSGKSRLRLDPIETLSERVKSLESGTTSSTVQQDMAREGEKMQSLQSDLKTLLDQAVKNEASLAAMRERLEKAESERVPMVVVYALGALVLLCLGALAYIWSRRPRYQAWEHAPSRAYAPAAAAKPTPAAAQTHRGMDVNTMDMDDETFDALLSQPNQAQKKL